MHRLKIGYRAAIFVMMACLSGSIALSGASAQDFYANKTITFSTHTGPGGEYDAYLRLMSQFMGKYIPGNPSIMVMNQPGAGGLSGGELRRETRAPGRHFRDLVSNGLLLFQALGQPGLEVSLGDFKWIGNFSAANGITVAMNTSGVKTIEEAKERPVIIGSTGAGSISGAAAGGLQCPGRNQVQGRATATKGRRMMVLAMRRGEIQGRSGAPWHDYLAEFPDEVKEGKLVALSQIGVTRDPRLPNAPLLTELVKDDPQKEAAARFISLALTQTRSLAAPPGVPDDRVAILRKAFDQVIRDPEFIDAAEKIGIDLDPVSGADVQKAVQQVLSTPKETIDQVRALLNLQDK